jgi:3-hydroxybutyryl-CoA dehydrogenase
MGAGIAEVCARAGLEVTVAVRSRDARTTGRGRLVRSLDGAVAKGRLSGQERDAALNRVAFTLDLADLADRDLAVEAIVEQQADKTHLLAALDKHLADDRAIMASTTSSVPIAALAQATSRPQRVIGLHFFSPVPAMALVEVIDCDLTDRATHDRAHHFVADTLGKEPVVSPDQPGFVVNALLIPYLLSAIRMVETGRVDAATVDRGMTLGCSHPVGPLRLVDLIGLDIIDHTAHTLWDQTGQPQFQPPALLIEMVRAGRLGRKTGHGFYHHG